MNNKPAKLKAVKVLLSIIIVLWLVYFVGLDKILSALKGFNFFYLIPAMGMIFVVIATTAVIIWLFIRKFQKIPFGYVLKNYLISWGLGFLLPSKVGEFSLAFFMRKEVNAAKTSACLVIQKTIFVLLTILFGSMAVISFFDLRLPIALPLVLLTIIVGFLFLLSTKKGNRLLKKIFRAQGKTFRSDFFDALSTLSRSPKLLFAGIGLSLLRLVMQALALSIIFQGFNAQVNLFQLLFVVAASALANFLPFTLSGLGLREGIFVVLTKKLGVAYGISASVALLSLVLNYSAVVLTLLISSSKMTRQRITKDNQKNGNTNKVHKKQKLKLMLSCGVITTPKQRIKPILEVEEFRDGKLVGICGLVKRHFFFPTLFLAVDEKYRNQGIGTKLVKEIIKKKKGIIFLTVAKKNNPAKKIYKKTGFIKILPWRKIRETKTIVMIHL